jgi:chromosome segregation ATPase
MSKIYLDTETSEFSESGDDLKELRQKNLKLNIEIDSLKKQLRDKEFELTYQVQTLTNENDNLKKTVQSFTDLVEYYKQQDKKKSDTIILEFQNKNIELNNKLLDLSGKLILSDEKEYNLKKEVLDLNSQISEFKIDIDSRGGSPRKDVGISEEDVKEFIAEIEELRKENADISERALNMLTEKEMQVIHMKDEINTLKATILQKEEEIQDLKDELHKQPLETSTFFENRRDSLNKKMDIEINTLRKDYIIKVTEWNKEKEALTTTISDLEEKMKMLEDDHEKEVSVLRTELAKFHQLDDSFANKDLIPMHRGLEDYSTIISNLEEKNDELNNYYKGQIKVLKDEMAEIDKLNVTHQQHIEMLRKELTDVKLENARRLKNLEDRHGYENATKEKDIQFFKSKSETLEKEKEALKKDLENNKVFYDKLKEDHTSILEQFNKYKETQQDEKHKLEEKIISLESLDGDRTFNNDHSINLQRSAANSKKNSVFGNLGNMIAMNETFDNDLDRTKLSQLENDVKLLNIKLKHKETTSNNIFRLNNEIEILKKEKQKIKDEMVNMKEMYERLVIDLLEKLHKFTTDNNNKTVNDNSNTVELLELEDRANNLKAENKFLGEQLEILRNDFKTASSIKDSVIKKQKEELEEFYLLTANARIDLAQAVFEKDGEIMKYKQRYRRLRERSTMSLSTYGSEKELVTTPNKKPSFFEKIFK